MKPAYWSEILRNVEKTIGQVLLSLDEQQKGKEPLVELTPKWEKDLEKFPDRFHHLQALACRAEVSLSQTDQLLAGEENHIRGLLREIEESGEKLVQWTARAVG